MSQGGHDIPCRGRRLSAAGDHPRDPCPHPSHPPPCAPLSPPGSRHPLKTTPWLLRCRCGARTFVVPATDVCCYCCLVLFVVFSYFPHTNILVSASSGFYSFILPPWLSLLCNLFISFTFSAVPVKIFK